MSYSSRSELFHLVAGRRVALNSGDAVAQASDNRGTSALARALDFNLALGRALGTWSLAPGSPPSVTWNASTGTLVVSGNALVFQFEWFDPSEAESLTSTVTLALGAHVLGATNKRALVRIAPGENVALAGGVLTSGGSLLVGVTPADLQAALELKANPTLGTYTSAGDAACYLPLMEVQGSSLLLGRQYRIRDGYALTSMAYDTQYAPVVSGGYLPISGTTGALTYSGAFDLSFGDASEIDLGSESLIALGSESQIHTGSASTLGHWDGAAWDSFVYFGDDHDLELRALGLLWLNGNDGTAQISLDFEGITLATDDRILLDSSGGGATWLQGGQVAIAPNPAHEAAIQALFDSTYDVVIRASASVGLSSADSDLTLEAGTGAPGVATISAGAMASAKVRAVLDGTGGADAFTLDTANNLSASNRHIGLKVSLNSAVPENFSGWPWRVFSDGAVTPYVMLDNGANNSEAPDNRVGQILARGRTSLGAEATVAGLRFSTDDAVDGAGVSVGKIDLLLHDAAGDLSVQGTFGLSSVLLRNQVVQSRGTPQTVAYIAWGSSASPGALVSVRPGSRRSFEVDDASVLNVVSFTTLDPAPASADNYWVEACVMSALGSPPLVQVTSKSTGGFTLRLADPTTNAVSATTYGAPIYVAVFIYEAS